jgi:protein O-mannosyl-transferase
MGWLWRLGILAPVIGLVQVGSQAMADRYASLPLTGPGIAVGWGGSELLRRASWLRRPRASGLVCALTLLAVLAWRQAAYWCGSETLWRHALECTSENYFPHYNLAHTLAGFGQTDEAIDHYRQVIRIDPQACEAHNNR